MFQRVVEVLCSVQRARPGLAAVVRLPHHTGRGDVGDATRGVDPLDVLIPRARKRSDARTCSKLATSASSGMCELEGDWKPVRLAGPVPLNAAVEACPDMPDDIVGLGANDCGRADRAVKQAVP